MSCSKSEMSVKNDKIITKVKKNKSIKSIELKNNSDNSEDEIIKRNKSTKNIVLNDDITEEPEITTKRNKSTKNTKSKDNNSVETKTLKTIKNTKSNNDVSEESDTEITTKRNKSTKNIKSIDNNYEKINNSEDENISQISNKSKKTRTKKNIITDTSYLRLPDNTVEYELDELENTNEKMALIFKSIDQAHNILFQSENIVGQKALQIIMSLIFIKLIQPFLSDTPEEGKIYLLFIP